MSDASLPDDVFEDRCETCDGLDGEHESWCLWGPDDDDDEPDETAPDCHTCGAPGTCHVHPCPEAPFDDPCEGCGKWFGEHAADCPL